MKNKFITKIETVNTGGGCMIDFVHLWDGRVLTLNDECLGVYKSTDDFWNDDNGDLAEVWVELKPLPSRRFVAYWGEGYGETRSDIVERSFFSADVGYGDENLARIDSLQIGESANLTDLSGVHIVTRVE